MMLDRRFDHDDCISLRLTYPVVLVAHVVGEPNPFNEGQVCFADEKHIRLVAGNEFSQNAGL